VKAAVEAGVTAAKRVGVMHAAHVIPRIHEDVARVILNWEAPREEIQPHQALGIVETVGFVPMVEAADAGVKAADVTLVDYVVVGSGYSSAIFRGEVAAVRSAVSAGAARAEKVGQVVASHVIPSPHPFMQQVLPVGLAKKGKGGLEIPEGLESALGFIEFKGFIGLVEATDTAVKAAYSIASFLKRAFSQKINETTLVKCTQPGHLHIYPGSFDVPSAESAQEQSPGRKPRVGNSPS
jgi:microcompartment protein CcmL/EutN